MRIFNLKSILILPILIFLRCSSTNIYLDEHNKLIGEISNYQSELTAHLLPKIIGIDSLICVLDFKTSAFALDSGSNIYIFSKIFEYCDNKVFSNLKKCMKLKGYVLHLTSDKRYPSLIIAIEYEDSNLSISVGTFSCNIAGSGETYYLGKEGFLLKLGNRIDNWNLEVDPHLSK